MGGCEVNPIFRSRLLNPVSVVCRLVCSSDEPRWYDTGRVARDCLGGGVYWHGGVSFGGPRAFGQIRLVPNF